MNKTIEGNVLFSVQDTGIGIPSEQLESIFDRFSQADESTTRKFGGTGLGLSISRQLVTLMGGKIWVESQVNAGTTFYFSIPLDRVLQKSRQENEHSTAPAINLLTNSDNKNGLSDILSPRVRVLLVDDNYHNRMIVKTFLKNENIEIIECENGKEAVDIFQREKFNFVLMDMQMPILDGYESTRLIREWEKQSGKTRTPIAALTADVMPEQVKKTFASGCDLHIPKPVRKGELIKIISKHQRIEESHE